MLISHHDFSLYKLWGEKWWQYGQNHTAFIALETALYILSLGELLLEKQLLC